MKKVILYQMVTFVLVSATGIGTASAGKEKFERSKPHINVSVSNKQKSKTLKNNEKSSNDHKEPVRIEKSSQILKQGTTN